MCCFWFFFVIFALPKNLFLQLRDMKEEKSETLYDRILSCIDFDGHSKDTQAPMKENGYVTATDKYSLIVVREDLCTHSYQPRSRALIPIAEEKMRDLPEEKQPIYTQKALEKALDEIPETTEDTCPACEGEKYVDFEFEYEGETYYTNEECPVCNGKGLTNTGVPKKHPRYAINLGGTYFFLSQSRVDTLLKVMKAMGAKSVKMTGYSEFTMRMVCGEVVIYQAGCLLGDYQKVVAEPMYEKAEPETQPTYLCPENVHYIFKSCLFDSEEQYQKTENPIVISDVMRPVKIGFHPDRIAKHRAEIKSMLEQLPDDFMLEKGGGQTVLNLCMRKDGRLWTGDHGVMAELADLGIASGMASIIPINDILATALPSGTTPYLCIHTSGEKTMNGTEETQTDNHAERE